MWLQVVAVCMRLGARALPVSCRCLPIVACSSRSLDTSQAFVMLRILHQDIVGVRTSYDF